MRCSRQSIRTISGGPWRISAAASPAIARWSAPSMSRPSIVTCSSIPSPPDAPQIVVGAEPRAVGGRALDLDDELARLHVGGKGHPVAVVEPGPGAGAVEYERRAADECEQRFAGSDREVLDLGRRGPNQPATIDRPDRAIGRHDHLRGRVDLERDRLAAQSEQRRLRRRSARRRPDRHVRRRRPRPARRAVPPRPPGRAGVPPSRSVGPRRSTRRGGTHRRPPRRRRAANRRPRRRAGRAPGRRSRRRAPPDRSPRWTNHRVARVADASMAGSPSDRTTATTAVRAAAVTATIATARRHGTACAFTTSCYGRLPIRRSPSTT